ncbi:hypothetical protein DYD21_08120 [Rhodohalobacter sp. SW132]|uniref:hypothetical protein n=1 Tax=Rhodohalobacter sp. SW132 TaxID=2293433 RepID=UPI000E262F27|nr:hypothetical protein [Rhodohalobacter sp. SW132]REL37738.1 hypothetical protein DYD21_08120 [Rhodohalobacter sp. SW132]
MEEFIKYLQGGDLRSIADVEQLIPLIKNQKNFDELFRFLSSKDRLVVMRAADAAEKITKTDPSYLDSHKSEIIELLYHAKDKELKWHLALMVSRIDLSENELERVWNKLEAWVRDKSESKIVRVNSLQALYALSSLNKVLKRKFEIIIRDIKNENIPSLNARINILTQH